MMTMEALGAVKPIHERLALSLESPFADAIDRPIQIAAG